MEIKENQITINGGIVNYATCGNGAPMVFLHNGGGFWQCWKHQMEHFSTTYEVFAIDWPSFGGSETPDGLLTMELLYETLNSFITELKLQNIILVGNCIGASVAYLYNIRHPKNVSKLVLFNICPGDLIFPKFFFRSFIPGLNKRPRAKKVMERILKFAFLKTPIKKKFPPILFGNHYNENDALFQQYVEIFKTDKQTRARINLLFSVHTYTFQYYLQTEHNIPHLLIWGEENSVTSYNKHGVLHCDWLQPEQFKLIPNSGHLCMYEDPKLVIETIEDYLNK
jgi:pimeloyl-ACP methyl ester carboxylesterase